MGGRGGVVSVGVEVEGTSAEIVSVVEVVFVKAKALMDKLKIKNEKFKIIIKNLKENLDMVLLYSDG